MHEQQAPAVSATYGSAALLAAAVGLRSMLPLALLAAAADRRLTTTPILAGMGRPWSLFRAPGALIGLGLAAAGEIVLDKMPFTPSRLRPAPLAGRLAIGALAGATVCRQRRVSLPTGAVLGAVAAGSGAAAGYYARQALDRATGAPDLVWAIVEDVLALGVGVVALRRYLRP